MLRSEMTTNESVNNDTTKTEQSTCGPCRADPRRMMPSKIRMRHQCREIAMRNMARLPSRLFDETTPPTKVRIAHAATFDG